ncbi:MAG: c-type cytochrome [Cocleimonas sp.]
MSKSHDKLPKLFWIQLALAATIGIIYLITPSGHEGEQNAETENKAETIAKNLTLVGSVSTKKAQTTGSTKARSGEEVYKASCQACHSTGIANAPKPDDKAAWESRVATGLDALIKTAIDGKGAMPARGGNPAITDEEIKAVILYMTSKAGFDLSSVEKSKATPLTTSAVYAGCYCSKFISIHMET